MKSDKTYFVYILTNRKCGVLYIGITNDLYRRIIEHKDKINKGFTSKYNIDKLVYYEGFNNPRNAIEREKQLKNWHRDWKINVIEKNNPNWIDLFYKDFD